MATNTSSKEKFRGATIEDLEPPAALSLTPSTPISTALSMAYERDYTHLTVICDRTRALLGYISIPQLEESLSTPSSGASTSSPAKQSPVSEADPVSKVMLHFRRTQHKTPHSTEPTPYTVITPHTPLADLEQFFAGGPDGKTPQDFAIVTDEERKFVLGVVTTEDLVKFVERRGLGSQGG